MRDNRRLYTSFYDIPFSNQKFSIEPRSSNMRFSRIEIGHLLIAISVLTIAFSLAFYPISNSNWNGNLFLSYYLPLSFLAIVTAFVCHELAHKYMGMKYGFWSEFRMYPQGLFLALVLSVFGFVFAAPGAVQIYGRPERKEYGHIALAGPLTNIGLSLVFISISSFFTGIISSIAYFVAYINIFLAMFNLLPFGPLDGKKVISWRFDIWIILFIISISIFIWIIPNFRL